MQAIWRSTFEKLSLVSGVEKHLIPNLSLRIPKVEHKAEPEKKKLIDDEAKAEPKNKKLIDEVIELNESLSDLVNNLFDKIQYPSCNSCHQPVCGKQTACACASSVTYKQEYLELNAEMDATEQALQDLAGTPFRQSRNGYGFAGGIFGGMNLLVTHIACGFTAACTLIAIPPVLLGAYVYWRGRREEKQTNVDYSADFFEKKLALLLKHREIVASQMNGLRSQPITETCIKPQKEKRQLLQNSFSHFIIPMLSTTGIIFSVFKIGVLSTLMIGAPISAGIAIFLGICAGVYFAYKRYQYLVRKVAVEKKIAVLDAKLKDFNAVTDATAAPQKITLSNSSVVLLPQPRGASQESEPLLQQSQPQPQLAMC